MNTAEPLTKYLTAEEQRLAEENKRLRELLERFYKIEDAAFGLKCFDVKRFKDEISKALNNKS